MHFQFLYSHVPIMYSNLQNSQIELQFTTTAFSVSLFTFSMYTMPNDSQQVSLPLIIETHGWLYHRFSMSIMINMFSIHTRGVLSSNRVLCSRWLTTEQLQEQPMLDGQAKLSIEGGRIFSSKGGSQTSYTTDRSFSFMFCDSSVKLSPPIYLSINLLNKKTPQGSH